MLDKKKLDLLDLTRVRKLNLDDTSAILNLIKSVFSNDYVDKEFYNIKIIEQYLKKINEKGEGVWKGVFLDDNLIGMMLAILEGSSLFLKMTMVDNKYANKGIITKLGPYMLKEIPKFRKFNVKSIYAFVNNNDLPILKTLLKFSCINFGRTPYYEENKCYLIYGLIVFDRHKHLISPHYKLHKNIEKLIKETKIRREIINDRSSNSIAINNAKYDLKIKKIKNLFPTNYQIFDCNNLCASFSENKFNNTWYNFRFLNKTSLKLQVLILKKIVELFYEIKKIKSF